VPQYLLKYRRAKFCISAKAHVAGLDPQQLALSSRACSCGGLDDAPRQMRRAAAFLPSLKYDQSLDTFKAVGRRRAAPHQIRWENSGGKNFAFQ
jgi:hypothetical protein